MKTIQTIITMLVLALATASCAKENQSNQPPSDQAPKPAEGTEQPATTPQPPEPEATDQATPEATDEATPEATDEAAGEQPPAGEAMGQDPAAGEGAAGQATDEGAGEDTTQGEE